jgi:hypothetical protein
MVLKVAYLHNYVVLEQVVADQIDLVLPFASTPLVLPRLEIVAPFWAIFVAVAHLISSLALKRYVILCLT